MSFVQHILLLTRLKQDKETSTTERRLFRFYYVRSEPITASLQAILAEKKEANHDSLARKVRPSWEEDVSCDKSKDRMRNSAAPLPSGDAESVQPSHPCYIKAPLKHLSLSASAYHRAGPPTNNRSYRVGLSEEVVH